MTLSPRKAPAARPAGTLLFGAALLIAALVFQRELREWFNGDAKTSSSPSSAAPAAEAIDHYTCPMHPSVNQPGPGKCPICGMDLVPVSKEQRSGAAIVIDAARRQLIGVRTEAVVEGPMSSSVSALGRVTYDESTLSEVNSKVRGWVTQLLVNQTGQRVTRGQTLLRLYSPDLYGAEQDFLVAHSRSGAAPSQPDAPGKPRALLADAARLRLLLLGLGNAQIDQLAARGTPSQSIELLAPAAGVVIEKNVVEGAALDVGMRLYRLAALETVWIEADVYESDLPAVRVGQTATVTLDEVPGRTYTARTAIVSPALDPVTRTAHVRLTLVNDHSTLRPGMYAHVLLQGQPQARVQVPVEAVIYTGPRRLVFVDEGEGRFLPREVRIGEEANGKYAVLSGLAPGESVATSGVFLIAAEARIRSAARFWETAPDGGTP
jgi:Cu(I)/Ag(I) efflux system membrane fusion protein